MSDARDWYATDTGKPSEREIIELRKKLRRSKTRIRKLEEGFRECLDVVRQNHSCSLSHVDNHGNDVTDCDLWEELINNRSVREK